jgi:putative phosphoribosyl transferase
MFRDRADGGMQLAKLLGKYKGKSNVVVLGLPRGGVVSAFEVAKALSAPLDVLCPRKVGAPTNSELALGAVTESGALFLNDDLVSYLTVSKKYLDSEIEKQKQVAKERMEIFRKVRSEINLKGKVVILVDDGLATGATMKAAILDVKQKNIEKCVVAIPVAPKETLLEIQEMADEVFCCMTPAFFQAVGQFYEDFRQTETEEVVTLLEKTKEQHL